MAKIDTQVSVGRQVSTRTPVSWQDEEVGTVPKKACVTACAEEEASKISPEPECNTTSKKIHKYQIRRIYFYGLTLVAIPSVAWFTFAISVHFTSGDRWTIDLAAQCMEVRFAYLYAFDAAYEKLVTKHAFASLAWVFCATIQMATVLNKAEDRPALRQIHKLVGKSLAPMSNLLMTVGAVATTLANPGYHEEWKYWSVFALTAVTAFIIITNTVLGIYFILCKRDIPQHTSYMFFSVLTSVEAGFQRVWHNILQFLMGDCYIHEPGMMLGFVFGKIVMLILVTKVLRSTGTLKTACAAFNLTCSTTLFLMYLSGAVNSFVNRAPGTECFF